MKRTFLGTVTSINATGNISVEASCDGIMCIDSFSNNELAALALVFNNKNAVRITIETQDPPAKARLDTDGTAEPLTRIVHHPPKDSPVGPGIPLHNPEHEAAGGKRTPLSAGAQALKTAFSNADKRASANESHFRHLRPTIDYISDPIDRENYLLNELGRLDSVVRRLSRRLAGVDNNTRLCDICGRPSTDTDDGIARCGTCSRLNRLISELDESANATFYILKDTWQAFIKRPR